MAGSRGANLQASKAARSVGGQARSAAEVRFGRETTTRS